MQKTLIIGSCTVDIVIPTPRLPSTGDSINSGVHHYALGGCAYNVSQMFRLLSSPYLHAFPVGSGIYGDYVKKELENRGIEIFRTSSEPHGACLCLVEESGERSFMAFHGVEYTFSRSWFRDVELSEFDSAFVCGLEIEEKSGEEIVSFLEERKFPTLYFAPGPRLMTISPELLERIFALRPIVHLNDQEVRAYTGKNDIEEAAALLSGKTNNDTIVTLGEKGALLYTDGRAITLPTRRVDVVDSIGAGDCHLGTYASLRSLGWSKEDALKKANLLSSEVVRHSGPTLEKEEVELLMKGGETE